MTMAATIITVAIAAFVLVLGVGALIIVITKP